MAQELGWQVAVYRVRGAAECGLYQQRLTEATDLLGGRPHRLWYEPVAGPADGPIAAEARSREIRRAMNSALRLVVLEYRDDVHDLVITAHPAAVDRASTDAIARLVLDGARDGRIAFDAAFPPVANRTRPDGERLALPWRLAHHDTTADLVTAVGLAHAWDTRDRESVVRLIEDGRETSLIVDTDGTVANCRAAVREQLVRPRDVDASAPQWNLVVDRSTRCPRLLDYRPAFDTGDPHRLYVTRGSDDTLLVDHLRHAYPARFGDDLHRIAEALLEGPQDRPVSAIERLDDSERRAVKALGESPRTEASTHRCVHELVREAMLRSPEAIALVDGTTTISYGELVDRADRMARSLRELGVRRGLRVGVCLPRSADLVVVLLAVLTAGGTYVPMDPSYPERRLRLLLEDSAPVLVVTDREFESVHTVSLTELAASAENTAPLPPDSGVTPDDPAYVIYTSGSTGKPKGVVVPHGNVGRLLSATKDELGFGPEDTWTWFHSVAFDFSVWEIWGALLTGGRLVVVPRWVSRSPEDFHALLVEHGVTVLNQTPSAFTQLLDLGVTELPVRLVIFGGEPLDARMLLGWFDRYPESRCRLINMYGITETTVHVTWHTVTRADALSASASVGRPIPGWSVRIVDEHGRLLPPGEVGEIAVGGDGLALHYLNRPELTAAKFITYRGERLYLSGDRGRLMPDGRLEHLGRLDNQIQLRGHRIEPDEIRAVLLADEAVVTAVVVHRLQDPDDPATARLDAYVVLHREGDVNAVRRRLGERLPEYMMPNSVTPLRSLPLTENGKLDVDRLPAPDVVERVVVETDPDADTLDTVLGVWSAVFRSEVTSSDDFFTLGGNSLIAVRIARALRDHGHQVDAMTLYRCPSPAELATVLDR